MPVIGEVVLVRYAVSRHTLWHESLVIGSNLVDFRSVPVVTVDHDELEEDLDPSNPRRAGNHPD